jgi:hypothetical protein
MDAQNHGSRNSSQLLWFIGVVTPSLLIVAMLIMFVGLAGWALLIDLREPGDKTVRVLLALVPYLGLTTWLGSAFLRFGVRLLPLASDGRRTLGYALVKSG